MLIDANVYTAQDGEVVVDFGDDARPLMKSVNLLRAQSIVYLNHAYSDAIRAFWKLVLARSGCRIREIHIGVSFITTAMSHAIADTMFRPDSPVRKIHISAFHGDPCPRELITRLPTSPIEHFGILGWNLDSTRTLIRTLMLRPSKLLGLSIRYSELDQDCVDGLAVLVSRGRIVELTVENIEELVDWRPLGKVVCKSPIRELRVVNCASRLIRSMGSRAGPGWMPSLETLEIISTDDRLSSSCAKIVRAIPPSVRDLEFNVHFRRGEVSKAFASLPVERIRKFRVVRLGTDDPFPLARTFAEALSGPNELRSLTFGQGGNMDGGSSVLAEAIRSRHCRLEELKFYGDIVPLVESLRAYRINPIPKFIFSSRHPLEDIPALGSVWLRILRTLLSISTVPRIATRSCASRVPFHDHILRIAKTLGWPIYKLSDQRYVSIEGYLLAEGL